jgi:endonuclease-3
VRAKTLRVAKRLEAFLDVPRQPRHLPPPLEMLIATILSQNTNDKNSHRAYTQLRSRYKSWSAVARAPLRSLISTIRIGGMANQKAKRIKEILEAIRALYGTYTLAPLASLSDDDVFATLTRMKGVGTKTAACVLLFSLGRDVFPVDTHVHRICGRLGLAPAARTPDETFRIMRRNIPKGRGYSFHTNLIRFGRRVCRSTNPLCGVCPLYEECEYEGKTQRRLPQAAQSRADHDFMLLDNVGASV